MKTMNVNKFWKSILHHFVPNVGTIVLVALMLFSYNVWAAPAAQETSSVIPYQGTLTDIDGNHVTANVDMAFRIYSVSSGGTALWEEVHTGVNAVPVKDGLFNVLLGSLVPIPNSIWENANVYLGVQVGTDLEMSPRELIGSLPTAIRSKTADTANFANSASMALTVPDGSITNSKLNLSGDINLGVGSDATLIGDYSNIMLRNTVGNIRNVSANGLYFFLDSNNNQSDANFRVGTNDKSFNEDYLELLTLSEAGTLWVRGSVQSGAFVENNLQTPSEKESEKITRFEQGDILCWDPSDQALAKCENIASPLVVAVADGNGKPIILGAEPVKVLGPVLPGELLVASDTPGYAVAWSQVGEEYPPAGVVIAKALDAFEGETGLIKAMISGY